LVTRSILSRLTARKIKQNLHKLILGLAGDAPNDAGDDVRVARSGTPGGSRRSSGQRSFLVSCQFPARKANLVDFAPRGLTGRAGWRNQHSGSSQDSDRCSVCRSTDELQARDEATGIQATYHAPGAVTMNTWRRVAIAAGAILLLATGTQAIAAGRPLVVVELFTSQGCSSCPSANAT
jgi:hypothetical protein